MSYQEKRRRLRLFLLPLRCRIEPFDPIRRIDTLLASGPFGLTHPAHDANRFSEPGGSHLRSELLAGLEAVVVGYLGAIARIVVRNSASRARTKSELYENIAAELEDPPGARKFVAWAESRFGLR